ncbi:MAG TPA: hypothetical protein VGL56_00830 [Fimbriimonadaceae bacterium]
MSLALQLPARKYEVGQKLDYVMTATNKDRKSTETYSAEVKGVVSQNAGGHFVENFAWSALIQDGKSMALDPAKADFRQSLSLVPGYYPPYPDLSKADPHLIGPITDLMTFYVDLKIATSWAHLNKPGDHFLFKYGKPSSWADGKRVILGEDSIDFNVTLKSVDKAKGVAVIEVLHIPSVEAQIKFPADWMDQPVAKGPNNWVQVTKREDGLYIAAVGHETFDVQIETSLADGLILSAKEDNPVDVVERICNDSSLTVGSNPVRYRIFRHIEIHSTDL